MIRNDLITSILLFAVLCTGTFGKIIYVDDDAVAANDGSNWENAYTFLQDALADANSAEKPVEIRVAQGIYKSDRGANQTLGDREATFRLINGVTLKGGFAGVIDVDPNIRDFEIYETILSGDLADNDIDVNDPVVLSYESTRNDNSYHVVTGSSTDSTAVLDGVTISSGSGNGRSQLEYGGGMYNINGSPTISNCTFIRNWAWNGGGIGNSNSSPTLTNCTFSMNSGFYGGGMYCHYSHPKLTNCLFTRNSTTIPPGVIVERSVDSGGGMYNYYSNPTLENCSFSGNSSRNGGGVCNYDSHLILTNCTLAGNSAYRGRAMYNYESSLSISNSIIWNGGNEIYIPDYASATITYSNIKNSWPGEGNITVDPLFVQPGYWVDVNDPNNIVEWDDPNAVWIDGDYHLKSEAGRWDPASESWVVDDVTSPCIDAGDPNSPVGDEPEPNGDIINMGAYGGTAEASMSPASVEEIVYVQWLGHSSVKVWTDDCIVYVDPQNLSISPHDATLVCVTHTHGDHYSPSDIARVSNAQTQFIAPPDVVQRYGGGETIAPGQTIEFDFVNIKAVPSYNTNKPNHPKSNNWVGFIIELGGKRIYVAGDTDLIEEMKSLGDINVAFLPAGGTYTMNATEAAEATEYIKPDLAIPYHWGRIVGTLRDAETFVELAQCPAMIMAVGEMISSDNWPKYSPLIAHWALDEAEGDIANDSADENHGTLSGEPAWQPAGGKIDGALLLDGINDYVSTDFVLDPANGSFSVFAWIKGGALYQVIISQADILAGRSIKPGSIWLCVDPLDGKLMTYCGLAGAGSPIPPAPLLVSESIITDGQWHHVGFVWDGSYRSLYVDGIEAARDTAAQNPLQSATSGLRIGAGGNLEVGNFFSGLIDDVRIYNLALTAEQIEELAN